MKRAIVSVTNDLCTDQRVDRTCRTLQKMGYEVLLVGRELRGSLPLSRSYKTKRMSLLFMKGPFFYIEYNIRLLFFLLFRKASLLYANDLDTLLPNYLASKIKGIPIIYDTHEYFTGVPELAGRSVVRSIWKYIEHWIFPKLKTVITVNDSIASLYNNEYRVDVHVIRNLSSYKNDPPAKDPSSLGLPADKKVIILQGSGINIQRGAEEAVLAMNHIENAVLLIIGSGDVMPVLHRLVNEHRLDKKVLFIPRQTPEKLYHYTIQADLGLSLDKDTNINYRYSLPNKLFDYIQARVPVLASDLPEISKIIVHYKIGHLVASHDPLIVAEKIQHMLSSAAEHALWKENLNLAAAELCWEKEEIKLTEILKPYAR